MSKKDRFCAAYEYLRNRGIFHTQQELADRMRASNSNISSALKGSEKVLTDKFLRRFNHAVGDVFNIEWLIAGENDMLRPIEPSTQASAPEGDKVISADVWRVIEQQAESLSVRDKQIDTALSIIEKTLDELKKTPARQDAPATSADAK